MSETIEFQAEARQLLQLMIHSIYSDKDVFLRELISNASDALDKLRLASYQDKDLEVDTSDLHIELDQDAEQRTLVVRDNGIGMTRDEVVELIGTIAKSGTREFFASLSGDEAKDARLIGQFGVGFYSAFMVADRLSLADICLYAYTHVAREGGFDLDRRPALCAWLARVADQPGHVPLDA